MKVRKNHTRFLCGSLAAAAAISPILSITAWADNISTANFNLRQQVVKLTGIMEISSFRESVTRADFAKMLEMCIRDRCRSVTNGLSSRYQEDNAC